jgi:hypothetical protein
VPEDLQFCDVVLRYYSGTNIILNKLIAIHKKNVFIGFEKELRFFLTAYSVPFQTLGRAIW